MTALYSINLHVMGSSNLPITARTIFTPFETVAVSAIGKESTILGRVVHGGDIGVFAGTTIITVLICVGLISFLKTELGAAMRADLRATGTPPPVESALEGITDTVIAAINYSLANVAFVENLTLAAGSAAAAEWLLRHGALQLLCVPPETALPRHVIIHAAGDQVRDQTMAVAASLLRHVPAEAMLFGSRPLDAPEAERAGYLSLLASLRSLFYPQDIPAAYEALQRFDLDDKLFERVDRLLLIVEDGQHGDSLQRRLGVAVEVVAHGAQLLALRVAGGYQQSALH